MSEPEALQRPCACFALRDPAADAPRSFGPRRAAEVAGMLRHAALAAARADARDAGWTLRYVAGHGADEREKSERLSYLVLPSIEPVGARDGSGTAPASSDGRIRRVLIAEPAGGSGESAGWAQRALHGALLRAEPEEKPAALLRSLSADEPGLRGVFARAELWASATPVVLPGHDDGELAKAERLLRKALREAGVEADHVRAITLQQQPFFAAAREARQYRVPAHLQARPRHHVRVRFRTPVRGPLVVGAGRHGGLGLLIACELEEEGRAAGRAVLR